MPSDDPVSMLRSEDPFVRLAAARALVGIDLSRQLGEVRRLRNIESDSWVRTALDRTISRWESDSSLSDTSDSWISIVGSDELQDIRAVAIQSVTKTLLHEIRPIVGDIDSAARDDIYNNYAETSTAHFIGRLRELLRTIQTLHDAAAAPRLTEFDLADLISREIIDGGFTRDQILATRTDSVVVVGDPDLLRLALQNAFRNAVEASETTHKRVVVNCGYSGSEAWVVVLDEGIGLPEGIESLSKPGITNKSKDKHFGWGLTIAEQAIHSLGGSIKLRPREHGGATCEIRWTNIKPDSLEPNENTPDRG
jgi:signal transduction histidine kinase